MQQISVCGHRAAAHYPGIAYQDYSWRKQGRLSCMIEISKRKQFYQQEYCGCVYSLRDTNQQRKFQGRTLIKIGKLYYGSNDE